MITVVPAILTKDFLEIQDKLLRLDGIVSRAQIDIIDGVFADNKTIDPVALEDVESPLLLDYHLMVKEPVDWVEKCVRGQGDRIIGHVEQMSDQTAFIEKVTEVGSKVGLAIDLDTPVSAIDESIITDLDVVLVMSVKAGFGGQKFEEKVLSKIEELAGIRAKDNSPFTICVDGGITYEVVKDVFESGADEVCVGKRLFEGDIIQNIDYFQEAAQTSK